MDHYIVGSSFQKHQQKNVSKKCTACKLTFLNKQDAKNHKQKDHMANYKGTKGQCLRSGTARGSVR